MKRRAFLGSVAAGVLGGALAPLESLWPAPPAAAPRPSPPERIEKEKPAASSVVLLCAPRSDDPYYAPFFDDLLAFTAGFVAGCHRQDAPLLVVDAKDRERVAATVGAEHLVPGAIPDIWVRDFGTVQTTRGLFHFRYRPRYLTARRAHATETAFTSLLARAGVKPEPIPLTLDGGNLVENGHGAAVTTARVLTDNPTRDEQSVRELFRTRLGIDRLAILPEEEGDATGHADGMVTWLTPNTIGVNDYRGSRRERAFHARVRARLRTAFPEVRIVPIPWAPTGRTFQGFFDATGIYANALRTPHAIYVPAYGLPQDGAALATFRKHARSPVVPIPVPGVAILGGSLRCLTCTLHGEAAQLVLALASEAGSSR